MAKDEIYLTALVSKTQQGTRLDQAAAQCFPDHSRARLAQWIKTGALKINGLKGKPKMKVKGGESLEVKAEPFVLQDDLPQAISLDIVYEDEALLVVNKPAGLVVHPAAGHLKGTLLNALLYHLPNLSHLPRAGIVHRLDKDTTGLMVVAKTLSAHSALVKALQQRLIQRHYLALVQTPLTSGSIDAPIGRHPYHRIKMAITDKGKPALTHYHCKKRYQDFTLLAVKLETGRTHQIRVRLAHRGAPIVGDALYGWRLKSAPTLLSKALNSFCRQALHAVALQLTHPFKKNALAFEAPLPDDFAALLSLLQKNETSL